MAWQSIVNLLVPLYTQLMTGIEAVLSFLVQPLDLLYYFGPFGDTVEFLMKPLLWISSSLGFNSDLHNISIIGTFLGVGFPVYCVVQLWKWVKTIVI